MHNVFAQLLGIIKYRFVSFGNDCQNSYCTGDGGTGEWDIPNEEFYYHSVDDGDGNGEGDDFIFDLEYQGVTDPGGMLEFVSI